MALWLQTLLQSAWYSDALDNVRTSAPKPHLHRRCLTKKGHPYLHNHFPKDSTQRTYIVKSCEASCPSATTPGAAPARGIFRPASPTETLSTTEANIIALETVMEWNLKTLRRLAGVQPVPLTPEWSRRIREAATSRPPAAVEARQQYGSTGVLCPWLPNTAAIRQLRSQGFKVVGVECSAAAVEHACLELGMGPEETGIHDGWVRHAADVVSSEPGAYLYRGNPYNLTSPVLSLVPFPLHAVWDVWGLIITPPELLPRYAGVWAALLPRGGVWLAAALVTQPLKGSTGAPGVMDAQNVIRPMQRAHIHDTFTSTTSRLWVFPEAAATAAEIAMALCGGKGLHAHDLHGAVIPTLQRAGFTVDVFTPPAADAKRPISEGAPSRCQLDAEDLLSGGAEALLTNDVLNERVGIDAARDGWGCQLQLIMFVIERT